MAIHATRLIRRMANGVISGKGEKKSSGSARPKFSMRNKHNTALGYKLANELRDKK